MGISQLVPKGIKKVLRRFLIVNVDTRSIYELPQKVVSRQFEGKTCIVTGGAGGIGRAICLRMACEGAKVYVCGRTKETVESVVQEIRGGGGQARPLVLDVTRFDKIQETLQPLFEKEGIDFLVNCAGGGPRSAARPFVRQDYSVLNNIIQTNLMGTINMCRGCVAYMPRGGGYCKHLLHHRVGRKGAIQ